MNIPFISKIDISFNVCLIYQRHVLIYCNHYYHANDNNLSNNWQEEEPSDDEKEHDKTVEYRLEEATGAATAAALSDVASEEMKPLLDSGWARNSRS